jgi:hypothetical protein
MELMRKGVSYEQRWFGIHSWISGFVLVFGVFVGLSLSFLFSHGVSFASGSAKVSVSAHVLPRVSLEVAYQKREIHLTEVDLARGFIDVPVGTVLRVRTNCSSGYFLSFLVRDDLIREVWVMESGRVVVISSGVGVIYQPFLGKGVEVREISYRFYLRDGLSVGTYSFPLRIQAFLF